MAAMPAEVRVLAGMPPASKITGPIAEPIALPIETATHIRPRNVVRAFGAASDANGIAETMVISNAMKVTAMTARPNPSEVEVSASPA